MLRSRQNSHGAGLAVYGTVANGDMDFGSCISDDSAAAEAAEKTVAAMRLLEITEEDLEGAVSAGFLRHDIDENGALDQTEFSRCIREISTHFDFNSALVAKLFKSVDVNADGRVNWVEFIKPATQLIMASKQEVDDDLNDEQRQILRKGAIDVLVCGMTEEELKAAITSMFLAADEDGSGYLDVVEMRQIVCQGFPRWELSDEELNYFMYRLDVDGNGKITLDEFLPVAFEILVETVISMKESNLESMDGKLDELAPLLSPSGSTNGELSGTHFLDMSEAQLEEVLKKAFLASDVDHNNSLDQVEFMHVIRHLGEKIRLDKDTARQLFRATDADGDGTISWKEFIKPALEVLVLSARKAAAEDSAAEHTAAAKAAAVQAEQALREKSENLILNGLTKDEFDMAATCMFKVQLGLIIILSLVFGLFAAVAWSLCSCRLNLPFAPMRSPCPSQGRRRRQQRHHRHA